MKIFLIGPGGVGKTTCGIILAKLLNHSFIDLDKEFIKCVENIDDFIRAYGHEKYRLMNSKLFYKLLSKNLQNFVFSLSSGFLVYENTNEITLKHKKPLKENGITILLLPSKSLDESMEIVVKRQLLRGLGLNKKREEIKFIQRFPTYKDLGDIKIFSYDKPEIIAEKMKNKIEEYNENNN